MNNTDLKQILNDEIKKRINSNSWNFQIASKVLETKRKKRKFVLYLSSASAFSFAAFVAVFFIFTLGYQQKETVYEQFIASQIQGTYNFVTNSQASETNGTSEIVTGTSDNNLLLTSEIDTLIADALVRR